MIVRDRGDDWQIVLQTDHADLSGQFARAWGNGDGFTAPSPLESVVVAAARHDDGWAVWERAPALDRDGVAPRNFLDVEVPSHLAFYRAMIAAVLDQDPYAGLLVCMHGAGIYRGRYGTQPSLKLTFADEVRDQVEAFVAEQEDRQARLLAELGVPEEERWTNYRLLQVYDRLSLYFCLRDVEAGEPDTLEPAPRDYGGAETALAIEPAGPWQVRIDPYPFAERPARFRLVRRLLPKGGRRDGETFRREFAAATPEAVDVTIEPR
ncbi:MAG TPA: DUF3891 family protein [Gaiellaceae bacterium]|nr:DUF3891 family protein [Gaiellaceae bacterium]